MYIPVGTRYTAAVSDEALKAVTCESCGREYSYGVHRTGRGVGMALLWTSHAQAKDNALSEAQKALQKKLEKATDLAACPDCGRYQSNMIARHRRSKLAKFAAFYIPGAFLAGVRISYLLPEPKANLTELCVLSTCILGGTGIGAWILFQRYNTDAESRAVPSRVTAGNK